MNTKVNGKLLGHNLILRKGMGERELSSPKSSVDVAISFLFLGLLISMDFSLAEALRNFDCNNFFSVKRKGMKRKKIMILFRRWKPKGS